MCGIIGYIGKRRAQEVLITGLKRMEYRGYDSAGIATHEKNGISVTKQSGKVADLESMLRDTHMGRSGIGHTRWATHGSPTQDNAHPHRQGRVTIVHNGIIENYKELKAKLDYTWLSDTDTEVLAALIDSHYKNDPKAALESALKSVRGTYGIAVLFDDKPDTILVARRSSPVLIAQDGDSVFIASDQYALAGRSSQAIVLQDDEIAVCEPGRVDITSYGEKSGPTETLEINNDERSISKDGYDHFMLKEIYEQPESIARVLSGRLNESRGNAQLGGLNLTPKQLRGVRSLLLIGCGTAYHAGLTAKYLLEPLLGIPISVEIASELRYRTVPLSGHELAIAISQSGETADTMACIEELSLKGIPTLGVINVVGSSIARMVDGGVYIMAGPEISVASTKAFTSQVIALVLIGITLARQRDMNLHEGLNHIASIKSLAGYSTAVLALDKKIKAAAKKFKDLPFIMTLGRDTLYPIALETALKIKEVSYIPTSGYPAGEMKHGPNALLGVNMGVVFFVSEGSLFEKSMSNLAEVRARDANVLVITDKQDFDGEAILLPTAPEIIKPLLFAIAGQLLAYHIAAFKGLEIDKPRNLAKSVTVE